MKHDALTGNADKLLSRVGGSIADLGVCSRPDRFAVVAVAALLTIASPVQVRSAQWVGIAPATPIGAFNVATNWSPVGVPSGLTFADFEAPNLNEVYFTADQSFGGARVKSADVKWLSTTATARNVSILALNVGGTLNPLANLSVGSTANPVAVTASGVIQAATNVFTPGSGYIVVDGPGSALNGNSLSLATMNAVGSLIYKNSAQGVISGTVDLGATNNPTGGSAELGVIQGADLVTGDINMANGTGIAVAFAYVENAGSTLVQTGAASLTIGNGSFSAGVAEFYINDQASITLGTGGASVKATGTLSIRHGSGVYGSGAPGSNGPVGGTGSAGQTLSTDGELIMMDTASQLILSGGAGGGVEGGSTSGGNGGGGGTINVTAGTANVSGSSIVRIEGGNGGNGAPSFTGGGGGKGGTINISAGATSLEGTTTFSLKGGNGGVSNATAIGRPGGAGGTWTINGGTTTIADSVVVNLQGGDGGVLTTGGTGGAGGTGGIIYVYGGALNMTGGTMLLSGGNGGPGTTVGARGTTGDIIVRASTFNMSGGEATVGKFSVIGSGAFNFTGGTLHAEAFNGNLTNAGGTIAPGTSLGTTTVEGTFTQSAGTLAIELSGTGAGQFDKLDVNGAANLGGALNVSLLGGFVPAAGQTFDVLDWNSRMGTFASLSLPALTSGLMWNAAQLYTTGTLAVAIVGDYNRNGVVDAADYVVWRKTYGQTGAGLAADGNANNVIDDGDFTVYRSHFGQTAGSGSGTTGLGAVVSVAVPEPASAVMLAMGLVVMCTRRRATLS